MLADDPPQPLTVGMIGPNLSTFPFFPAEGVFTGADSAASGAFEDYCPVGSVVPLAGLAGTAGGHPDVP
ncbi:hypothetical protein [Actinoplanes subglobosus]|uniref:Uncharacterized protein n=1 Tax=Actinoplanes subglobosus TaxID=1547892 RepID=A0ABV8IUK8_9ACTN